MHASTLGSLITPPTKRILLVMLVVIAIVVVSHRSHIIKILLSCPSGDNQHSSSRPPMMYQQQRERVVRHSSKAFAVGNGYMAETRKLTDGIYIRDLRKCIALYFLTESSPMGWKCGTLPMSIDPLS